MANQTNCNQELLSLLKTRFLKNDQRHYGVDWESVQGKVAQHPEKLDALWQMEQTGGEPDVVGYDEKSEAYIFCDCSRESPSGRRSVCYDRTGLEARKNFKPAHNATDLAAEMGIELLTEVQYQALQKIETVDEKTSSWLKTPADIRKRGGALFGDFRYGRVFIYHNGASAYYKARGFRGCLRV